jgi:hypothetical protein
MFLLLPELAPTYLLQRQRLQIFPQILDKLQRSPFAAIQASLAKRTTLTILLMLPFYSRVMRSFLPRTGT